ncbi:putative transcription factor kapC [Echria macrotheca]|uniref:Putative transcription factor kapC n=1 Tax=Echria macrotheca TaxID=438768 RepID=A0AAJ0F8S4_9PEZI|nr:putative transcription factor kapC [Echria macrotheca]
MEPATRDPAGAVLVNNHAGHTAYSSASFTSHSGSPPGEQGTDQASPVPAAHPVPHGYNHAPPTQDDSSIHPQLRSTGETAPPGSAYPAVPVPNMMPAVSVLPPTDPNIMSGPIPAMGTPAGAVDSGDTADGRKAKRELSQSKRAAQNRAAQRAFRQRKEGYIKKLEQQVRDLAEIEANYKNIQNENYELKAYIVHLQSRLLDLQGEYPQPPPNVNLQPPHGHQAPPPEPSIPTNPLEVAAQAVAGLSRSELSRDHYAVKYEQTARVDEDQRTAEEITRQLAENDPDGLA